MFVTTIFNVVWLQYIPTSPASFPSQIRSTVARQNLLSFPIGNERKQMIDSPQMRTVLFSDRNHKICIY